MENLYPIHVPSKGRYNSNITVKAIERMKVVNYKVTNDYGMRLHKIK